MQFNKLMKEIVKWNINTLPRNTFKSQKRKFVEEEKEFIEALKNGNKAEIREELVDIFITIVGLERFGSDISVTLALYFLLTPLWFDSDEDFENEVTRKFNIIKGRTYKYIEGVYHNV